jgi:hypothetical protein
MVKIIGMILVFKRIIVELLLYSDVYKWRELNDGKEVDCAKSIEIIGLMLLMMNNFIFVYQNLHVVSNLPFFDIYFREVRT